MQISGGSRISRGGGEIISDIFSRKLHEIEKKIEQREASLTPLLRSATAGNYRPQRSCGKVMFSQACQEFCPGGGVSTMHWGRHPPSQCMLGYTPFWSDTLSDGHYSGRYASYTIVLVRVVMVQSHLQFTLLLRLSELICEPFLPL